ALEKEPEKLAARAWETPLHFVGSFLDTAKRHGRDMDLIGRILTSQPSKLSISANQAALNELVGFLHYAPEIAVKIAVADFQPTHWDGIAPTQSMNGATWVAGRCGEIGRDDLKSALITKLLRRANSRDFPPQTAGLANAAWLLKNTPSDTGPLVHAFLNALCTPNWLGWQFKKSSCGVLAAGLRLLGLHQPPEVIRLFHDPSLSVRLENEFSKFALANSDVQSEMVQLLGCATLCGWSVMGRCFRGLSRTVIEVLPVDVLSHKPGATKVEDWQFQLWLGLRAIGSITNEPLSVPPAVLNETLCLWCANLAESANSPKSTAHLVNQSMVAWLERCRRGGGCTLLPDREPLWVYAGFPARLEVPRPARR
ncbi:MAG: hypothetical protein HYV26_14410, partial [Candidatus Hydrogenedentes bacterium]|nr:hypothetical protein [Candidatus Hydrogenedentota bacterium]